ncbi:Com family DNA-binding transcriptional regulator [Pseudomonas sp. B21-015]|uniref:Com family DNA-binding transcriptional regulator n=1 Tax=Pseudomonas sp. B21-015 TaxID=2895473 RepID=UPI002160AD94|nr:Com family DNA-binding transcriptional regulator [Pseudomonas sp. B21-015]UVM53334.1 Com family DNA-binding transcriptional regulator [Pseudomonas sp. B21-015]
MLKDCRCGYCKKLLARMGEYTELQIKCSRCGTLNHVKAASLERSPMSDMSAASAVQITQLTQ